MMLPLLLSLLVLNSYCLLPMPMPICVLHVLGPLRPPRPLCGRPPGPSPDGPAAPAHGIWGGGPCHYMGISECEQA